VSETETERQKAAASNGDSELEGTSADPNDELAESTTADAEGGEEPANRRARRAAAARARKQRVQEREEAQAIGLDAQEMLDDALVRSTDSATKWLKKNANALQWVFVGGITIWAGWGLYGWQKARSEASNSDKIAKAAAAQFGKVGEDDKPEDNPQVIDPTPVFADQKARLEATKTAYDAALKGASNDGVGLYARLALASVLIEQGKVDDAKAEYDRVLAAKFTEKDAAIKAQAQEGLAQIAETKGDKAAALALYEQIAAANLGGASELGQYNQARLLHALNRNDEAKKLIAALYEKHPPAEGLAGMFPSYLEQGIKTLANILGVEAPKAKPAPITQAQINDLAAGVQRQLSEGEPKPAAPAGETQK
jgi:hypothetical protein